MRLWAHHESGLRIDAPDFKVDPTKGQYWRTRPRYRHLLPELCRRLGLKKLEYPLWCCTDRDWIVADSWEDEWELNVPPSQVISLYRVSVWDDIFNRTSLTISAEDWGNLFPEMHEQPTDKDIGALVRVPLAPGSAVNHGKMVSTVSMRRVACSKLTAR